MEVGGELAMQEDDQLPLAALVASPQHWASVDLQLHMTQKLSVSRLFL